MSMPFNWDNYKDDCFIQQGIIFKEILWEVSPERGKSVWSSEFTFEALKYKMRLSTRWSEWICLSLHMMAPCVIGLPQVVRWKIGLKRANADEPRWLQDGEETVERKLRENWRHVTDWDILRSELEKDDKVLMPSGLLTFVLQLSMGPVPPSTAQSSTQTDEVISGKMSNTDMRGVNRGACQNCDCEEYMFVCNTTPACYYCSCPPTKHMKIESFKKTKKELVCPSSSNSNQCDLESLLPAKLPGSVEVAMRNNQLTTALRSKIVRAIADRCFAANATPNLVDEVADLAVNRWSLLKSDYGHQSKSFALQIKRRLAKLRIVGKTDLEDLEELDDDQDSDEDQHSDDLNLQLLSKQTQKTLSSTTTQNHLTSAQPKTRVTDSSVSTTEHLKVRSPLKDQNKLESLLPAKLPRSVEIAVQNNRLTSVLRCRIVRAVADRCFAANAPPYEVDMVADIAVNRWSPLKSDYGHQSKAFAMQVKRRIAKLRTVRSTDLIDLEETKDNSDSHEHDLNLRLMSREMQKTSPSRTVLKKCLNVVRPKRQIEASSMSAVEHLKVYPALKCQDMLLWEFCSLLHVTASDLEVRWVSCLEALKIYLHGTPNAVPDYCLSSDMKTIHVLSVLPFVLPSGKKTKEASKLILELFLETTNFRDTVPRATDPPRLIGIGKTPKANMSLTCFLDSKPLFKEQAVKALLLLIACYWVFDIKFSVESRPSFLFVSCVLLKDKFQSRDLVKTPSVTGILKQLNLNLYSND